MAKKPNLSNSTTIKSVCESCLTHDPLSGNNFAQNFKIPLHSFLQETILQQRETRQPVNPLLTLKQALFSTNFPSRP